MVPTKHMPSSSSNRAILAVCTPSNWFVQSVNLCTYSALGSCLSELHRYEDALAGEKSSPSDSLAYGHNSVLQMDEYRITNNGCRTVRGAPSLFALLFHAFFLDITVSLNLIVDNIGFIGASNILINSSSLLRVASSVLFSLQLSAFRPTVHPHQKYPS